MVMWERPAGPVGGDDAALTPGVRSWYATHGKRFLGAFDDGAGYRELVNLGWPS